MADIAFLVLIFFFTATQILDEQGIRVTLPPYESRPAPPTQRDVFHIHVNAGDAILAGKELVSLTRLPDVVHRMITHHDANHRQHVIISLHCDRECTYKTFLGVYDAISTAYRRAWDDMASEEYGQPFATCSPAQKKSVMDKLPMIISEAEWRR